jgi:hypothetical protein
MPTGDKHAAVGQVGGTASTASASESSRDGRGSVGSIVFFIVGSDDQELKCCNQECGSGENSVFHFDFFFSLG